MARWIRLVVVVGVGAVLAAPGPPEIVEAVTLDLFPVVPDGPPLVEPLVSLSPTLPLNQLQRALRWKRTGGPVGGLGYDIRLVRDPSLGAGRSDAMYVTDAWAGVFRSFDGGRSWTPAVDGIGVRTGRTSNSIPIFSLTIDPHDDRVLWAGTKDKRGIFRSDDRGAYWTELVSGIEEEKGITVRGFTVDPQTSDTVYAAAEISSWTWSRGKTKLTGKTFDRTMGVVYRTEDGGQSWSAIWRGDNLARYVWIDPDNPDRIYISTGIFDREAANGSKTSAGGVGVVRSLDGGTSWHPANKGLENLFVGSLFMHPDDPKTLIAAAGSNPWNEKGGVYVTTTGGDQWKRTLAASKGEVFTAVELAPHPHEDTVTIAYAGSRFAIYRSQDGGTTWRRMSAGNSWGPPGILAGWPIDFQVDPDDPQRLFANAYGGGAFLSTDGGATWSDASKGYTGAQVRAIAVDPFDGRRVFAAGRSGVFRSDDSGDHWTGLVEDPTPALDWTLVEASPHDSGRVLGASIWKPGRLVLRDPKREGRWQVVATIDSDVAPVAPASQSPPRLGWRGVAFAASDSERVYVGTGGLASFAQLDDHAPGAGVFRSDDGGATWAEANDELSDDAHVHGLAVDADEEDWVYAATSNHGLLRTTDGGATWTADNAGFGPTKPAAMSVAVDPSRNVLVGLFKGGLYRRAPGEADPGVFKAVVGIDPNATVVDIAWDPSDAAVVYCADRRSGVYRSGDGGKTWTGLPAGLDVKEVNALGISMDGATVYAGTEGAGVYRLDVSP